MLNKNLEEQAVVLFRSWFSAFSLSPNSPRVNSEFGEIPENFAVVKVGSLPMLVTDYVANGSFASLKANVNLYQEPNYAYFIRNTDLKSGSFGVYVDQHSYEFLSKSTLFGGEIIISNVGDVGSVFLCPKLDGRMTLGNNIIMLRPEDDHLRYYLYIWFKYLQGQALIQGIKGGSAQPKFNKTDFKNTSVLIPPKDMLTRFHETVAPMFETISQRQTETSRLADLRDTLLPQLMSGEIDVSDLDL
jgi:type I restriction enzyme S subunit